MKTFSLKQQMIGYLAALLLLGAIALGQIERVVVGALLVIVAGGVDMLWSYGKTKQWHIKMDVIVFALLLALIFDTAHHPYLALFAGALTAVLVHVGKVKWPRWGMHPVALSLVILSFFAPVVSWWGVSWGNVPLLITFAVGLFFVHRLKQFSLAGAFFVTYAVLMAVLMFVRGSALDSIWMGVFDGALFFFISMLLIDVSAVSGKRNRDRVVFGCVVGVCVVLASFMPRVWLLGNMDAFLLALVAASILMPPLLKYSLK